MTCQLLLPSQPRIYDLDSPTQARSVHLFFLFALEVVSPQKLSGITPTAAPDSVSID